VYLDASDHELVNRYEATRRRHPLADEAEGLLESIQKERTLLESIRADCDLSIDTTDLNVHQLKSRLLDVFETSGAERLEVTVESFGFKYGIPLDADVVMDVRFLPNPHWEESLRPLTGLDEPVRRFVFDQTSAGRFVDDFVTLISGVLPEFVKEGKSYLTVAVGCTGGRHRSVAIAEEVANRLRRSGQPVRTGHRDVGR
jgi:UPF0042 nucleotide-binding protein